MSCTVLLAIAPPLLTHWGEPAREGNIVSFFPLRHRGMKEHSSPPPRPRSRLSSPSPSPLTPCYPQTGGVEGVQGDLEISAGVGSRIQISSRGELMPRLLSIRNWPRAKKKKKKRNKNPLCLTPSPALLSLLTGICSDIISWPVLCPSHIKWWARLITIQGIFLLLLSSTAKWKPLVHPPCAPFCSSPLLPSCCCQLKNRVHSALTIERESESHFTSDGTKDTTEEWSPVPVDFNHLRPELGPVFNIPCWPSEQWKGLTHSRHCLPHPRGGS